MSNFEHDARLALKKLVLDEEFESLRSELDVNSWSRKEGIAAFKFFSVVVRSFRIAWIRGLFFKRVYLTVL